MLPQFPESEWISLLSGRAIDLDHVLASHYSTSHEEKCTECIGEIEFVVGCSRSTKAVEMHGNWVLAWDRLLKQCSLSSSTDPPNLGTMAAISLNSSPHSNHHCIPGSSSMTERCKTTLPSVTTSYSPISPTSLTSTSFISRSQELPRGPIQKDVVETPRPV